MSITVTKSPAQLFALVIGVVYLLVGLSGFAVTGLDNFADAKGADELIVFAVNPLHNIVHIALGAIWIGASRSHAAAKTVNLALGAVLLLVAALGFAEILIDDLLAIDTNDNVLHVATGAASILFGTVVATDQPPTGRTTYP